MLGQDFRVTEDDKTVLRTRQGDIETTRIRQETNALVVVGAHTGEHDEVLFSTLKGVHGGDFDLFVIVLLECALCLHSADDVAALAFVGCDNTNRFWTNTSLEETRDDLLDVGCFRAIQVRGTRRGDLLVAQVRPEHHRIVYHRPREVDLALETLLNCDAILQGAVVEHIRWELRQAGMHAILDLKANW